MRSWESDVWAADGDPATRGADDRLLQEAIRCNRACARHGITDNFIKVAFYQELPDWFNDAAWAQITENFYQCGVFARDAGMRGIALDTEYLSDQYDPDWEGYSAQEHSVAAMKAKVEQRGAEIVDAMFDAYPGMDFITLPEGVAYYGELAGDLFRGFVRAAADRDARGGVHLFTESTYSTTTILGMMERAVAIDHAVCDVLGPELSGYWRERCSMSLGGWPLGYYRKILDEQGNMLGYGGKEETFGNEVVGSYADKSERFPLAEFRQQLAGMRMFSGRYCWIYGHGATWWGMTPEEVERYGGSTIPVVPNIADYYRTLRQGWIAAGPELQRMAESVRMDAPVDLVDSCGMIAEWLVLGPFHNPDGDGLSTPYIDEDKTNPLRADFLTEEAPDWRHCRSEHPVGYVDLVAPLVDRDNVCAYALVQLNAEKETAAQLRLGLNDGGAAWINGEQVFFEHAEHRAKLDQYIVPVTLKKGRSRLLLKVFSVGGGWGFYARLTDTDGAPIEGVTWRVPR